MNEQQGKRKDNELHNSLSDMTISDNKNINNPMIYSGDTKDFSKLLSKNPSPAIKDLLQKNSYGQIWFRKRKYIKAICCK